MKENSSSLSNVKQGPTLRITRSRAASLTSSSMLPPKPPAKENQFKALRGSSKRPASAVDNKYTAPTASSQQKRRAVLTDVTNFCCTNSSKNCIAVPKVQVKIVLLLGMLIFNNCKLLCLVMYLTSGSCFFIAKEQQGG